MSLTLRKLTFIQRPLVRFYWKQISKGKNPREALSLQQKIEIWNYRDPALYYRVNIGYQFEPKNRKDKLKDRLEHRKQVKNDYAMQLAAKNRTLKVPLDAVQEEWSKTSGPLHVKEAAEYYGIFDDLFENGYFTPVLPLHVTYSYVLDNSYKSPVYRGNILKSYEAVEAPSVTYDANEKDLYTLAMTTPDCHLTQEKGEYVHWLVGNIPGNKIEKGQKLVNYLQPFPPSGAGYCRYIFVLYKQEKRLDFSEYQRENPCTNLTARTFSTYDFYRKFEDNITPLGLAFFQSDWDPTLTEFFHKVLEMEEPSYEYDFEDRVLRPQEWFPEGQPFNLYLDAYKDPKQLQKELLIEKLKERHPFEPPPKPPKYPLAFNIPKELPTWLKDDIRQRRVKEGKWKFM